MVVVVEENEQGIEVARVYEGHNYNEPAKTFVDEETVADVLGYMAVDMETVGCVDPFCMDCIPARVAWWRACNSLSKKTRRGLQALMRDAGVALPVGGCEEEEEGAVPTPQHG